MVKRPFFDNIENTLFKLHLHLDRSERAGLNLRFWADVVDQGIIEDLRLGKARWLAHLGALENLNSGYLQFIAHLYEVYMAPKDSAQKALVDRNSAHNLS